MLNLPDLAVAASSDHFDEVKVDTTEARYCLINRVRLTGSRQRDIQRRMLLLLLGVVDVNDVRQRLLDLLLDLMLLLELISALLLLAS